MHVLPGPPNSADPPNSATHVSGRNLAMHVPVRPWPPRNSPRNLATHVRGDFADCGICPVSSEAVDLAGTFGASFEGESSMAVPRREVVDDDRSGEYHCYDRCVRRYKLLASEDDHRRGWLVDRLHVLSGSYAIDIVSMAVLDNHMHTIVRTLPELAEIWSDREVAYRWLLVHQNRTRRRRMGLPLDGPPQEIELDLLCDDPDRIAELRRRLGSVSWFMKDFKEPIARRANQEDGTTGRFWQDRFQCKPLVDKSGVLSCATYIDMNPVVAGMAEDALTASFTSVHEHMRRLWPRIAESVVAGDPSSAPSMEELLAHFDKVAFTPAIPCRREPHLPEESGQADAPASDQTSDQTSAEVDESELDADEVAMDDGAADSPAVDAPAGADSTTSRPRTRLRSRRRIPPVAVLGMTLGAYLRRLGAISRCTVDRMAAKSSGGGYGRDPAEDAKGLGGLAQRVLDGVDDSIEALSEFVQGARLWGTAIGSSKGLADEAIRRNKKRVICGFR